MLEFIYENIAGVLIMGVVTLRLTCEYLLLYC